MGMNGEDEACNTELRLAIGTSNLIANSKNDDKHKRKALSLSMPVDMDPMDEYSDENQDDVVEINELDIYKEKMGRTSIHGRKKLRLNRDQLSLLEETFQIQSTLSPSQKQVLGDRLNLQPRQVEVWFQNRRARTKLKQTEVDCELLKKCCERLSIENQRLRKEVQELRGMIHPRPACCMHKI
ncbi:homeobox-leucine zipper protein HAT22-like [Impatiens glandulifera]|uniref:homeobox-leucine zipper protein HAT22-like n=1 Tax=Impatiens glandulifera TaxID=253017 RepID=UPI001FB15D8E|nr:homeobox-leucine zipper protein HAT22-like [Impatiens glandulifera]